jgi:hypothetical protein
MDDRRDDELRQLREDVRRLQESMEDTLERRAILDCVHRYARGLDRHDEEILRSVFHEDALDHHGDFLGTREEFVPWANALHEEGWTAHTHMLSNHRAEIDGDVAHAETYVLFVLARKDGKTIDLGGGRYVDRLERRGGEWRIAARELVIDWRGEASASSYGRAKTYPTGAWDSSDASYRRPFVLELPVAPGGAA